MMVSASTPDSDIGPLSLLIILRSSPELRIFLQSFFFLELPDSYYIQLLVCAVTLVLLNLWGLPKIVKLIINRKFWLVRNQETASNQKLFWIPNASSCFMLIVFVYYWLWIGYSIYSARIDRGCISGSLR